MTNCRYPLQLGLQRAQFRAPLWALRVSSTSTGADVRPRSARGQPLSANGARNGLTFPITLQSARSSDHRDQRHDKCRKFFTQSISRSADNVLRCAVRTEMLDPIPGSFRLRWKHIHSFHPSSGPSGAERRAEPGSHANGTLHQIPDSLNCVSASGMTGRSLIQRDAETL